MPSDCGSNKNSQIVVVPQVRRLKLQTVAIGRGFFDRAAQPAPQAFGVERNVMAVTELVVSAVARRRKKPASGIGEQIVRAQKNPALFSAKALKLAHPLPCRADFFNGLAIMICDAQVVKIAEALRPPCRSTR